MRNGGSLTKQNSRNKQINSHNNYNN